MTVEELYNHITAHMTPEEALKKMLAAGTRTYEKLKFPEGEAPVPPEVVIVMAAIDLGWGLIVEKPEVSKNIRGLVVGTEQYLEETMGEAKKSR